MNNDIDILKEFLSFPINNTDFVFEKFKRIENHIFESKKGKKNRKFIYVEGSRSNKALLVAHADTVWEEMTNEIQEIYEEDGFLLGKNKKVGIGADDRAGCAILWQLRESGHSLLVVDGEELGCISSNWINHSFPDLMDKLNQHQFMIEFDRRNAKDYKCYLVGTDEFRQFIEYETGYTEPNRTSGTDITVLCRDICGVNFSVGYYDEHTANERINIEEWQGTLNMARKLLSKDLPQFKLYEEI